MARLITSKAEKEAASYLDWDDAALGAFCKKMAFMMDTVRKKKKADGVENDDFEAVVNASDGILLVGQVIANGLSSLTVNFGDFTHCGEPSGDWEIRVCRVKSPDAAQP